MIVPGLGFTTNGKRLGRGRGYYDRCIADYEHTYPYNNLKTIGLSLHQQLCDDTDIPNDEYDKLIDIVISPN